MLALILAADLVTVTNQELQLKLTAVKSQILVGEFTKLRLEWTALKSTEVLLDAEDVLIDDGSGTGFHAHLEANLADTTSVALPTALAPGQTALTEYKLGLMEVDPSPGLSGLQQTAASLKLVFSHPGRYRVMVRYTQAESNAVEIDAVAPTGRAAELLQQLLRQPAMLTWMVGAEKELSGPAESLVEQYGSHPYLARTILELIAGTTPDGFERLRTMGFSQSAFADEHLLRVAVRGGQFLGEDFERQTLQQVIERFPDSLAARQAQELLRALDQPPSVAVSASPSSLWPPNHELVQVTVSVDVADDRDPHAAVKLVSITCDDSCDPTRDVAEATLNADDRSFQLRAERTGGGPGRSYAITYSATDAAGNTTTATTTVLVPHDQRP